MLDIFVQEKKSVLFLRTWCSLEGSPFSFKATLKTKPTEKGSCMKSLQDQGLLSQPETHEPGAQSLQDPMFSVVHCFPSWHLQGMKTLFTKKQQNFS